MVSIRWAACVGLVAALGGLSSGELWSTQGAAAQSAAAPRSAAPRSTPARVVAQQYVWVAQVVAIDRTARTVTMTVPFKPHVARYIGRFKPGERIIMTWGSPKPGETDAVIYVAAYDPAGSHADDYGYVLPAEIVSSDTTANTLTFKAYLTAQTLGRFAAIRPEQWVRVTSPFDQSKATAAIDTVQASARPEEAPTQ